MVDVTIVVDSVRTFLRIRAQERLSKICLFACSNLFVLPLPNPPPLFLFLPIPYPLPLPLSTPATQASVACSKFENGGLTGRRQVNLEFVCYWTNYKLWRGKRMLQI